MSLINKVLRDLEAQRETADVRAQQSPLADAGLHPVRRVRTPLSRMQLVRIGLSLALSVAAALAWYQWDRIFPRGSKPARVAPAPAVVPSPPAVPQQTEVPVAVPGTTRPAESTEPQHMEVLPGTPKDAKSTAAQPGPMEPPAAKPSPPPVATAPPAKAPAVASPAQDVIVRKPSLESIKPEAEAVKAAEPIVTTKAAPVEDTAQPDAAAEESKGKPASKASVGKPRDTETPSAAVPKDARPAGKTVLEKKLKPFAPEERAENEYRLAAGALQQRRAGEAESRLRAALNAQPSHVKARELLAGLALQGGHWREAQSLLEQGVALQPNHYPFAQLLARSYVEHGQEKKALDLLEKSRAAAGGDADYLAFLATLYQRAGRHDDAARNFGDALQQRPQEGRWWLGLAISLEAAEKWKQAAEAYRRAAASGSLDKQLLQYSQQRLAAVKGK